MPWGKKNLAFLIFIYTFLTFFQTFKLEVPDVIPDVTGRSTHT